MGGSSSPSKTTTTTEPPALIRPYMQYGAEQSRALYETGGPSYYPGNTVVPFAPQTERALGLTEQRALSGSPVTNAAQGYLTGQLNSPVTSQFGGATPFDSSSNPYLDSMFNKAAQSTRTALDTQFAGAGRNLEAQMPARADQLNDLATSIYGGAYENDANRRLSAWDSERSRMASDLQAQRANRMGLLGFAPQLANQDYVDLQALQGVGGQVEDLTGRLMEDQAARYDFAQNRPQTNLDAYLARITGAYPGQTATQTTPTYRNRTAGAAGGALAGAQMGSSFGPYGALIGAIGGGLLGGYA